MCHEETRISGLCMFSIPLPLSSGHTTIPCFEDCLFPILYVCVEAGNCGTSPPVTIGSNSASWVWSVMVLHPFSDGLGMGMWSKLDQSESFPKVSNRNSEKACFPRSPRSIRFSSHLLISWNKPFCYIESNMKRDVEKGPIWKTGCTSVFPVFWLLSQNFPFVWTEFESSLYHLQHRGSYWRQHS